MLINSNQKQYRLLTRSDFDGLASAVLLKSLALINEIKFVHPKDMQDGKIEITNNDITTNLPYSDGVHLAFAYQSSETLRNNDLKINYILDTNAPSTSRLIYNYFGGKKRFAHKYDAMLKAVDKSTTGEFTIEDILQPQNWSLLNFVMDPRTGLGRFKDFRISNYQLMLDLVNYCNEYSVDEILNLPDVKERVDLYFDQEDMFKEQIERNARFYKNVGVFDLRNEDIIYAGNRYMIYALFNPLFPQYNVSIYIMWGLKKQNTVLAVGKSIFNRAFPKNIGEVMLKYGGGGHIYSGSCQVENDQADIVLQRLITLFNGV
jgi:nanoRNase/pAp phosphatase (c-di-AMP/oligoRNAs hydrolase)